MVQHLSAQYIDVKKKLREVQCNLSTTATHGTAKSGCYREVTAVERSNL